MADILSQALAEPVRPDYNIYRFTDQIYKIVYFKSTHFPVAPPVRNSDHLHETKLSQSLSRARRSVLEIALCNDWKYFCTFTLDPLKYDRNNLSKFKKDLSQFVRDQRKKWNVDIQYIFVPEMHDDGCWHCHGLVNDLSVCIKAFSFADGVPVHLVQQGYYNWPDYQKKFGFVSLGFIKNKIATAFYVSKYIYKAFDRSGDLLDKHLYLCSTGLNRAVLHGDIYGYCQSLDQYLVNDYDFCRTGMTHVKDGLGWDFALQYMDYDLIEPFTFGEDPEQEVDNYYNFTQAAIAGFAEVDL